MKKADIDFDEQEAQNARLIDLRHTRGNGNLLNLANGELARTSSSDFQEGARTGNGYYQSADDYLLLATYDTTSDSDGGKASFSSSVVNLANTILGAGMLGLPYAFSRSGYIGGMIALVVFGAASALGLWLLAEAAEILGMKRDSSFYKVANAGIPKGAWLIDAAILIKCFGVATSYCIVLGDLMPDAMHHASGLDYDNFWVAREFWITLFMITAMYPLSLLQTMDALKFTSTLALFFVAYLVGVVSSYAFSPSLDPCEEATSGCPGTTSNFLLNLDTMKVLSIFIFAFTCHQNAFIIKNELRDNTRRRMGGVITTAIGTAFLCYTMVAVAGYYSLGSAVKSNVINNYPSDSSIMTTSRIAISLLVAFSYPLQINPARASLFQMIYHDPVVSTAKRIFFTTLICGGTFVISLAVDDLGQVLSVVGATGSTIISYILPGLVYFTVVPKEDGWTITKILSFLLALSGVIFMPLCLVFIFL